MKTYVVLFFTIFLIGCGGQGSSSYKVTKMTLEKQEKNNPKSFLSVSGRTWENLSGETVIKGDIKNNATIAQFKDVILVVDFYTKTNTHLGSQRFVVYEFVKPGQSAHYKLKMIAPAGTENVNISVESAKAVD